MSKSYKAVSARFVKSKRVPKRVPKYGVYDTVINSTPYTVCAYKDQNGVVMKQAFAHKDFSPEGARYKAERFYNQYLASCAEQDYY